MKAEVKEEVVEALPVLPSPKEVIDDMNQEIESEQNDENDQNEEIEVQGTEEPEIIIKDIPVGPLTSGPHP